MSAESGPSSPARRSLLRAGAHAAWIVPAVTVVAAAPALAVSGPAALTTLITPTWAVTAKTVSPNAIIRNGNTQPTVALEIDIILEPMGVGTSDFYPGTTCATPAGFTQGPSQKTAAGGSIFYFYAQPSAQIIGGGSLTFNPLISLSTSQASSMTVSAIPGGGGTTGTGGPQPSVPS